MKAADLKFWLSEQGFTVRELAAQLDVPLKTVQDWVYRGAQPSSANRVRLEDVMCTHHWVIDAADGHLSRGVCKLCHADREFENSQLSAKWSRTIDTRRVS